MYGHYESCQNSGSQIAGQRRGPYNTYLHGHRECLVALGYYKHTCWAQETHSSPGHQEQSCIVHPAIMS
jgi:hypothetical protein